MIVHLSKQEGDTDDNQGIRGQIPSPETGFASYKGRRHKTLLEAEQGQCCGQEMIPMEECEKVAHPQLSKLGIKE